MDGARVIKLQAVHWLLHSLIVVVVNGRLSSTRWRTWRGHAAVRYVCWRCLHANLLLLLLVVGVLWHQALVQARREQLLGLLVGSLLMLYQTKVGRIVVVGVTVHVSIESAVVVVVATG